mmetsp:Transcript_75489/g.189883  ORF Transcript_75489/g.189883 Transcript_75489/m.189883 type:complete len:223 (+) Transcript_75489:100-768(+)
MSSNTLHFLTQGQETIRSKRCAGIQLRSCHDERAPCRQSDHKFHLSVSSSSRGLEGVESFPPHIALGKGTSVTAIALDTEAEAGAEAEAAATAEVDAPFASIGGRSVPPSRDEPDESSELSLRMVAAPGGSTPRSDGWICCNVSWRHKENAAATRRPLIWARRHLATDSAARQSVGVRQMRFEITQSRREGVEPTTLRSAETTPSSSLGVLFGCGGVATQVS